MNFYDFHIGDYARRTGHLEPLEDLAYRRMLDLYYTREAPLPADPSEVARLIRMRNQVDAVGAVLREFFELMDDGWRHGHCDEVIEAANEKRAKAKASADKRWHSDGNANGMRPHDERTAPTDDRGCDPTAPSPSPSPSPKEEKKARKRAGFKAEEIEIPEWLPPGLWGDWCADRRTRGKPITERGAAEQIASLDEYRAAGHSPERVIRHAIASGNQGLYPPPRIQGAPQLPQPAVEVWKPPPPLTPEEREASAKARDLALGSLRRMQ